MDNYVTFFFGTYFIFLTNLNMQMRKLLSKKLKSNEGASLMVALLFFVVCAALGSIVLSTATVASGRMAGIKRDSQTLEVLVSTARLFEDEWNKGEAVIKKNGSSSTVVNAGEVSAFNDLRKDMMTEILNGGSANSRQCTININIGDYSSVNVTVEMTSDYSSLLSFTIPSDDANVSNGLVTLSYKASDKKSDFNEDRTITWSKANMSIGGNLK